MQLCLYSRLHCILKVGNCYCLNLGSYDGVHSVILTSCMICFVFSKNCSAYEKNFFEVCCEAVCKGRVSSICIMDPCGKWVGTG